ncbi:hypothetical protein DICPUDRAFT_81972 [Dictyostelium purpureum]|uniref:SAM domain-containing protein n=1 Tax=Dictyostelium purpureum TaxID=5786 RepID=F0ZV51_DICPU|nr:uncharacterized protein DICPUDRAFT_81972 [Dictyostelium purpureum]EGC32181.1 hypothetical protein DICPUDRAFT_81972 [Dictyostelium purpureum]|eukprot:XP_003291285.1 hypothetical protein DICPUDRAFT_81972 [Dictyostelium purpureum]
MDALLITNKHIYKWNHNQVCNWLEKTGKFTPETIKTFNFHQITGEHLEELCNNNSFLLKMGISINNCLSFIVEYKKLKSNEEINQKNNYTQNSDYDAKKSTRQSNINNSLDSTMSQKLGIVKRRIIEHTKPIGIEKKKSLHNVTDILKNNVLNQLEDIWKNEEFDFSCLIIAYEKKNFSLLELDTLGKRLNFQYEMSILLRNLHPSMVSYQLVDEKFLEKNVEQVNDALMDALIDQPTNYNALSEIFMEHNINGIALLSIMEEDLVESLGIVDDNLKNCFIAFYKSLFKT